MHEQGLLDWEPEEHVEKMESGAEKVWVYKIPGSFL